MIIKTNHPLLLLFLVILPAVVFSQDKALLIEKMAQGADLIFTGKVIDQNSVWNKDKTRIYTNVTIQVEEYLKGENSDRTIIVTHPGGEIGNVGELYTHIPTFQNKEEVLLFVKKNLRDKNFEVFQGENGKLSLIEDKRTGEKRTTQNWRVDRLKEEIKLSLKN